MIYDKITIRFSKTLLTVVSSSSSSSPIPKCSFERTGPGQYKICFSDPKCYGRMKVECDESQYSPILVAWYGDGTKATAMLEYRKAGAEEMADPASDVTFSLVRAEEKTP